MKPPGILFHRIRLWIDIKIVFHESDLVRTALSHLDGIFDYYIQYSERTDYSFIKEITETGKILENHPEAGRIERFYEEAPENIRALITCKGLFKILYYEKNNIIYIFAIFSCRQDPAELKRIITELK